MVSGGMLKAVGLLAAAVLVSGSNALAQDESNDNTCKIINWTEQGKDIGQLNQLLVFAQTSGILKDKLKAFDPLIVQDKVLDGMKKEFLGLDFLLTPTIKSVKANGLSSVTLPPINVTSPTTIKFGAGFAENVNAKLSLALEIKQLSRKGCQENEEHFLGLCYKTCHLLTNGEYPKRIAPNICATNSLKPKWSGFGCNGFGVGADEGCAKPYHKACLTDLLNPDRCSPLTISIDIDFGIDQLALGVDTEIVLNKCPPPTPYGKKCTDVTVNDILTAAMTGQLDALVKRMLRRVKTVAIASLDLSYGQITELTIDNPNDGVIADAIADFLVKISKEEMNKKGAIAKFVIKEVTKIAKNEVNKMIVGKLGGSFGNTCYDA